MPFAEEDVDPFPPVFDRRLFVWIVYFGVRRKFGGLQFHIAMIFQRLPRCGG